MFDVNSALSRLDKIEVAVIGDLMLDVFVYGDVARISPEAPTPVLAITREVHMLGGAANVARNLAALGCRTSITGLIGADSAAGEIEALVAEMAPAATGRLLRDPARPTTRKIRYVSERYKTHLLRADAEMADAASGPAEDQLAAAVEAAVASADAVILSDYRKGVLTPRIASVAINAAKRRGVPVVVDPKGPDVALYAGCTLIKPNKSHLAQATRMPVDTDLEFLEAARWLRDAVGAEAVLVTRSEEGMTLVEAHRAVTVPAEKTRVRDVSGAGDTVIATLAAMLGAGAPLETAARAANAAAGVVVGKSGTATVSWSELRTALIPQAALTAERKIVATPEEMQHRLAGWRAEGARIGFTNGCFDLLHPGHVHVLTEARRACDRLVVGINSDASVQRLKGPSRPIQDEAARAEVLAALEAVDLVAVFDEDTPAALIEAVKPLVLVKGGDYQIHEVVGRDTVEALGGEVILVPLIAGRSTTSLVAKSRKEAAE